jgi:protein kinase-like protein
MTEEPLATGLRASGKVRDRSTRDGHDAATVTALEPSEPSRGARRRLRLAVAARAAIDHPNLVRAWAVGEGDGRLFVAVERCPHPSLSELLGAAPLEPTACARVLDGAAAGVDALSQQTLVARDLTPERVLVDPERGGVLMDLGIPPELLRRVPLEQDPDLAFRSPEELERTPVDVRSGVYSLGAILFTALTGRPPDDYSSRVAEADPRPSDQRAGLSPEVDAVVARAMAQNPAERYANPEALARAAAAAVGAELAPPILPGDLKATQRWQQPPAKRAPSTPRPNGRPSRTRHPTRARRIPPQRQRQPQPAPGGSRSSPRHAKPRPASRRPHGVTARLQSAARRCLAMMAGVLALTATAGRRGEAGLRRFASAVAPTARRAASVAVAVVRRAAHVVWALLLRGCRWVVRAARRAEGLVSGLALFAGGARRRGGAGLRRSAAAVRTMARSAAGAARRGANVIVALFLQACRLVVAAGRGAARLLVVGAAVADVAGRRALTVLLRLTRSASSVGRRAGERIDRIARGDRTPVAELVGSEPAASQAGPIFFGSVPMQARERRFASIRSVSLSSLSHRRLVLPAVGAIVASALAGIMFNRALESDGGPSSLTRAGLTVQPPPGWEQARVEPGRPAISSAIAAGPPGEAKTGLVVGKIRSQAAAERMLEWAQSGDGARTQVRLGKLYAWRYAGLRPRPGVTGTGYLLPITGGAVLMVCHASKDEARVRLAECGRAATTLVVRGERPRRLSSVDRSRQRLIRVITALSPSRADGRQRLAAAELAPGQVRAATSLQLSRQRAARSVERVRPLEHGRSLGDVSTALHAAAAAYGRLAGAATTHSRMAYREASRAVAREEEALRRALARVSAA